MIANAIVSANIQTQSYNRSHYIFTLVQKVKNRAYKIHAFINKQIFPRLCKLFHLKMTWTSRTDKDIVKVTSFQNVTFSQRRYQFSFLFV